MNSKTSINELKKGKKNSVTQKKKKKSELHLNLEINKSNEYPREFYFHEIN